MRGFGFPRGVALLLILLFILTLARSEGQLDPLQVPWTANSAERMLDLIAPWEQWWVHDCTEDPGVSNPDTLGWVCMFVAAPVVDLAEYITTTLTGLPDLEGWLDWSDPWHGWVDIGDPGWLMLRHNLTLSDRRFVVSVAEMEADRVSVLIILWVKP